MISCNGKLLQFVKAPTLLFSGLTVDYNLMIELDELVPGLLAAIYTYNIFNMEAPHAYDWYII